MNDSLDLSAAAFGRRRRDFPEAPSPVVRGYAAAELSDGTVVTGRGRGALLHAEVDVLQQVRAMPGLPEIVGLYSERQPCCACETILSDAGVPPEAVAYSAEYFDLPGDRTAADAAELDRLNNGAFEALRQMIREAEGVLSPPVLGSPLAQVARQAVEVMRGQGLPVVAEPDLGAEPGVELVVDELDDEGQGIYLTWYVGAELTERVLAAVQDDRLDDAALTDAAAIKHERRVELKALLDTAGFKSLPVEGGFAPYTLRLSVER